jgi:hypothetical protein
MNRQEAKIAGSSRYTGRPCINCGKTERYTRNKDCIACRIAAECRRVHKIRVERGLKKPGRPKKYPELVGPVKPRKKHDPKPVTEFEKWVYRSRHNKKATLRNKLTYDMYMALYVTHCPLLGVELSYSKYEGTHAPSNYASLDKIDPSKGYVEGNVQILSFRANTLKGHASLEELKIIVDNWTKQKI